VTKIMLPVESIATVFAGNNRLFQEGMARLLGERFNIINYAGSLQDALAFMRSSNLTIDLLIGDPGALDAREFEAIADINHQFPDTKLIVLTSQINRAMLDTVIQNGASGVLSNDISVAALLYSIEIVLLGERIAPMTLSTSAEVTPPLRPSVATRASEHTASLSGREQQILHCLVGGLPNKSIASTLDMAESTVKVHLKALLRKLNVENRTQAAVWAMNRGFSQNAGNV
jgi:two-component system nitrate/nitrite response regulator NarL